MLNRPILYYVVDLMKLRVPRWLIRDHLGLTDDESRELTARARELWPDLPMALRPAVLDPEVLAMVTAERHTSPQPLEAILERVTAPVRVSPGVRLSDASWAVFGVLQRAVMPLSAVTLARRLAMPADEVRRHIVALRRAGRVESAGDGPNGRVYRVPAGVSDARC